MPIISDRFKNAWNAFLGRDPTEKIWTGFSYASRPDRQRLRITNLKSMVSSVYGQIAVDCSSISIRHVKVNEEGEYEKTLKTTLNRVLTQEANIDQTGRDLIRDTVISLLDEGCIAIVPIDTLGDPNKTDSYKILSLRVGKIVEWMPKHIRVEVYNDVTGNYEQLVFAKRVACIIENPFYAIMNEPNSTAKRLMRTIAQLDRVNDENTSGKLDLIIQLPYTIKSDAQKKQAERRRKSIEAQLTGSAHGIAYTDGTERIVQLNRPVENTLWEQVKDLETKLYNQLGFSESIFNGTADEKTMLNYYNRTIEPILSAIVENMERKWISRTAQTQGQAIRFFREPFKLVPVNQLADIVDKFTRNEVMSSNEFRSVIGLKPSDDPKADELRNSNLNHPEDNQIQDDSNKEVTNNSKSTGNLSGILSRVSSRKV